jgi:hypothetical protein
MFLNVKKKLAALPRARWSDQEHPARLVAPFSDFDRANDRQHVLVHPALYFTDPR